MGRLFQAIAGIAVLVTLAVFASGQMRVDVRLVNVVTTVTDSRGRGVANLTQNDFILEEDGKPQRISHFSQDQNVPVSIGILLDTSGSMERRIRTASEAVARFGRRIQENDEIFLMTFSSGTVLRQDFTGDREKLSEALRHLNATGGTALYDALNQGLKKVKTGKHTKRAILLITDGRDTASTSKLNDVLRQVRQSELLIYPVGISGLTYAKEVSPLDRFPAFLPGKPQRASSDRPDTVDLNVLRALAENSGGRAFLLAETFADRGGQIEKVLDTIADELRSQYTLGFYPSRPDDGRYRSLRVRTLTGNNVRARRGYLAITP